VVAPHPDDDAIGCGGAIARAVARGSRVEVVYVTDGSASHPRSKRFPPAVLRDVREGEARAGLRALGVNTEPRFLRVPDGTAARLGSRECARVEAELAAALTESRCDLVLGPWRGEPHPDHAASATLLQAALARLSSAPRFLAYAVWLFEFGDEAARSEIGAPTVEISLTPRESACKRAAIEAHRSQTTRLIDDDPDGFWISPELLERWVRPSERFYGVDSPKTGTSPM
jgi:LmbE family N-acetylglucosaminyl deacetylase